MSKVHLYLLFDGNCAEAFGFYKSVFGGEFLSYIKYGDIPQIEGVPSISENDKQKVENISLEIAPETILMGADAIGEMAKVTVFGNNFSIYIEADNTGQADKLYKSLSEGGYSTMPMTTAHWGGYFGMLTDRFGINWLINKSAAK